MGYINPCYLLTINNNKVNEIGDCIQETVERKVYVDVSSVRQSEFYQAQIAGFKPELTIIIRNFEYKGEERLLFNNKKYRVLRTYDKKDGTIELTCAGDTNGSTQSN